MIYDEQSQKRHRFFFRSSFCDASFLGAIIKNDIPLRSWHYYYKYFFFSIYYCIRRIMFFLFRLYRWSAYNITFIFFLFDSLVLCFFSTFLSFIRDMSEELCVDATSRVVVKVNVNAIWCRQFGFLFRWIILYFAITGIECFDHFSKSH